MQARCEMTFSKFVPVELTWGAHGSATASVVCRLYGRREGGALWETVWSRYVRVPYLQPYRHCTHSGESWWSAVCGGRAVWSAAFPGGMR